MEKYGGNSQLGCMMAWICTRGGAWEGLLYAAAAQNHLII